MSVEAINEQMDLNPIRVHSKRRTKGIKSIESWTNLVGLLEAMGAGKGKKSLFLNWEDPQKPQFDLLIKIMNQLTNINLNGNYSNITKEWRIFA